MRMPRDPEAPRQLARPGRRFVGVLQVSPLCFPNALLYFLLRCVPLLSRCLPIALPMLALYAISRLSSFPAFPTRHVTMKRGGQRDPSTGGFSSVSVESCRQDSEFLLLDLLQRLSGNTFSPASATWEIAGRLERCAARTRSEFRIGGIEPLANMNKFRSCIRAASLTYPMTTSVRQCQTLEHPPNGL